MSHDARTYLEQLGKARFPFGAVAHLPGKPDGLELITALLGELTGLSLFPGLVLTALVRDPITEPRDFAQTRDKDVSVTIGVGLEELVESIPVIVTTTGEWHMKTLEHLDLDVGQGRSDFSR